VTHPDIERFFMTIREAVQLVLQASALGAASDEMQGRIFVLDMGEPVRIADLARQMIRLAGLQPEIDVPIVYTGLRAGEKLYEELSLGDEELSPTAIPRLNVVSGRTHDIAKLDTVLSDLESACQNGRTAEAIALLTSIVPEYTGRGHAGAADGQRAAAHA
jgi:O-antigen biosynthesis protein WbqV